MNLGEVVAQLDTFDDDDLIWVRTGEYWPTSQAEIRSPELPRLAAPWRYLLEVGLAAEAIDVWRQWRPGREPSVDEMVRAVAFYGLNDAWEPLDPDAPLEMPLPEPQQDDSTGRHQKIRYLRRTSLPPEERP